MQAAPVEFTAEVLREMLSKHPRAREGEEERLLELRVVAAAAAAQVDAEAVAKALNSFPRSSAAGPSGLRPQHLKEAFVPGFRDEALRLSAGVVN